MKVLQEGALADFLNRFMELILLNVLWFICSLPVFTLGASTCAMYEVTLRWSLHESPAIVGTFFRTFRRSFRKAAASERRAAALGLRPLYNRSFRW